MSRDPSVRYVSARELSRNLSSVLDNVQRTGSKVIVLRNSQPAAMISPVGEIARRARVADILSAIPRDAYPGDLHPSSSGQSAPEARPHAPLETPELDGGQTAAEILTEAGLSVQEKRVLLALDEHSRGLDYIAKKAGCNGMAELGLGLTNLEMKLLATKVGAGFVMTPEGAHVRVALEAIEGRGDGAG